MTKKTKTGASPLHLDNTELRRELYRADAIILNAVSMMSVANQLVLQSRLVDCHVTSADDPLAEDTRLAAMHRITPKYDWLKTGLAALIILLSVGLVVINDENQRLSDQLAVMQGASHD